MIPVAHEFFGGCMIATLLVGMIALAPPTQMEPGAVAISAIAARGPQSARDARALAPAAIREAEITDARFDLVVMNAPESAID